MSYFVVFSYKAHNPEIGLERRKKKKVLRDLFPAVGFRPFLSFAPILQARTKFSKDDGISPQPVEIGLEAEG